MKPRSSVVKDGWLFKSGASMGTLVLGVLLCWISPAHLSALHLLSCRRINWVALNVDHAPMGTCSTMTYGYQDSACGVGTSNGQFPCPWA